MKCLYCGGETRVANSRRQRKPNTVWRRRRCLACHTVFTSIEEADLAASVVVKKHASHVEPFCRDKLLLSVYDSLRHRKTAIADAESLSRTVIARLLPNIKRAEIKAATLRDVTYSVLKRFDGAAATYYRAYHPVLPGQKAQARGKVKGVTSHDFRGS